MENLVYTFNQVKHAVLTMRLKQLKITKRKAAELLNINEKEISSILSPDRHSASDDFWRVANLCSKNFDRLYSIVLAALRQRTVTVVGRSKGCSAEYHLSSMIKDILKHHQL